jgi:putative addiction module component (TIGR02574 family)
MGQCARFRVAVTAVRKDVPVTEAQRAELDRRIAEFEQDREQSVSWDQLSAELRQRR